MKTSAAAAFVLSIVMATITLAFAPVYAQQATQAPAEPEQDAEQDAGTSDDSADNVDEPTGEQADTGLPDIDNQPIQPGSGGPGRFIPSEQISQELGVSFPVDI